METKTVEAFSINHFCKSFDISRGKLYQLWEEGNGPLTFRIGRKVLISRKSATEWVEALERAGYRGRLEQESGSK